MFGEISSSQVDPGSGREWWINTLPVSGRCIEPDKLWIPGFTPYETSLPVITDDIPTPDCNASPQPIVSSSSPETPSPGAPFTSRAASTPPSSPSSVIRDRVQQPSSSNSAPSRSPTSSVAPSTTTSLHGTARTVASPFALPIDPAPRPQLQKCTFCGQAFPSGPPSVRGSVR